MNKINLHITLYISALKYYLIIELNMAENCSTTLLNISWMADEFSAKAELILDSIDEISKSGVLIF